MSGSILAVIVVIGALALIVPLRFVARWLDRREARRVAERRANFYSVHFPDEDEERELMPLQRDKPLNNLREHRR